MWVGYFNLNHYRAMFLLCSLEQKTILKVTIVNIWEADNQRSHSIELIRGAYDEILRTAPG